MKKQLVTLTLLLGTLMGSAYASNADIAKTIEKLGFDKKDIKISNTPVPRLKRVTTPRGVFYVTEDGKYLTEGPIYDMSKKTPVNIANSENVKLIASIDKNAIVYKAKNEKYVVSVFTDYTCSYCKKFHEEIDQYLDAGISIHYFAFPRKGLNSEVAKNMQSIWSVRDRKTAFDNAYKTGSVSPASSMIPYIQMQYTVGVKLGISGTPAIVLPNGQLVGGYVPVEQLLDMLDDKTE